MGGAQIAWTVELGYGTPFLLSLGLSEQLTSLVWLAGPISGLIAQPLIGAISDSSTSKYRRRLWIASSTVVLLISTLILAYCQGIAAFFVDLFGGGAGDWDPKRAQQVSNTAIGLAVVSFYLLDFALNALQASLRNLLLDITPSSQLNAGNAWHSRMSQAGNIIGFGFGFLPLANLPILRLLGGSQFRKFCVLAMIILVITVWITCWTQEEQERRQTSKNQGQLREILSNIYSAIVKLPKPIRRVCFVQVFAFMGWFPFLFYATTYVGQVMAYENKKEPDAELATRMGALAMLIYSLVAVVAGAVLPQLSRRDKRLLAYPGEDEDTELERLKALVQDWKEEAADKGKTMKLPVMPLLLRTVWMGALLLFSLIAFSTFFVETVNSAIVIVSLVGICWAVACWVPFAIIMEFLKEMEEANSSRSAINTLRNPADIHPETHRHGEREPLLRRHSGADEPTPASSVEVAEPVAGGTVLGIHNLAIVFPQFIVAIVSSIIFKVVDGDDTGTGDTYLGKNGVAWALRFGGLSTLVGALVAGMLPLTRTEKEMRRILRTLKAISESESNP